MLFLLFECETVERKEKKIKKNKNKILNINLPGLEKMQQCNEKKMGHGGIIVLDNLIILQRQSKNLSTGSFIMEEGRCVKSLNEDEVEEEDDDGGKRGLTRERV